MLRPAFNRLQPQGDVMHALKDLFTSDVGLMSIGGIAFMLGMAVFFIRYFLKHIQEDTERAEQARHAN
jgi:hypothetical protein